MSDNPAYLSPTMDGVRALLARGIEGPVVMLNLLRFKEVADYSATPELAPATPISGEAAYQLYMDHTEPFLAESGGKVLFYGKGGPFFIGLLLRSRKGQSYAGWEKAMLDAYQEHIDRLERGEHTLIDPYGATNHEEFFAEAIVTFFERGKELRREEPALYAQLAQLLALDPAQWPH